MNEFLTTLRSTHLFLIAVSLTLAVFALSPRDSELYHAAQLEAESLTKVNFDRFKQYAWLAKFKVEDEYVSQVRESLAEGQDDLHITADKTLTASLFFEMWFPRNGEPIAKIRDFVDNFEYSIMAMKVPNGKRGWQRIFGDPVRGKQARCFVGSDPYFGINPKDFQSCPPLQGEGELVNIMTYEILPATEDHSYTSLEVHVGKVRGHFTQMFRIKIGEEEVDYVAPDYLHYFKPESERKNYGCVIILGEIGGAEKFARKLSKEERLGTPWDQTNKQAKSSPCYNKEPLIDESPKDDSHFQRLFPHLHLFWSQVASLNPAQAAEQLSIKSMQSRQVLSIGGLSVDERMVLVAGPSTVLFVAIYFLINLVMLRTSLAEIPLTRREPLLFPWLCLYDNWLSLILTLLTVVLLPTFSILAILSNTSGHWGWGIAMGYTALCLVFCCGYSSFQVIKQIKCLNVRGH